MKGCVFCKIRDKIIPKEFTYEDEDVMVFPDIYPIKPIHLLIIPKEHIEDLLVLKDEGLIMKLTKVAQQMAIKTGLNTNGYRLGINGGGAQGINHLHVHLIGPMGKNAEMSA